MWSFGIDFTRNFVTFGVYNTWSYQLIIKKVLALGEKPTEVINDSVSATWKKIVLTLLKQNPNFVWIYIITELNKTEIYKYMVADNKRWY